MQLSRIVEYVFFFGLLVLAGYMVWQIAAPFITALALSAIIVTITGPLHQRILRVTPRQNRTLAAFLSTIIVLIAIILPLSVLSSLIIGEVVGVYQDLESTGSGDLSTQIATLEATIVSILPIESFDLVAQAQTVASWFAENLGTIFAGTVSTLFTFFIAIIGAFYFFRDGDQMLELIIKASPLSDEEDRLILARTARAVRSVATGTLLLAIIQGTLVALGFLVIGIDRAVLWGTLASVGALMPGIGTTIVTAPAIVYLFASGSITSAFVLLIYATLVVGLVDNFLGPYLISRQNNMHPFIILIAVLGGISVFGPIGFIVGPVIVTLFFILLEIYNQYIIKEERLTEAIAHD